MRIYYWLNTIINNCIEMTLVSFSLAKTDFKFSRHIFQKYFFFNCKIVMIKSYLYCSRGNCHPDILANVRQYYDIPEFLPLDAEFPATENIFFGYEIGAVMHVLYFIFSLSFCPNYHIVYKMTLFFYYWLVYRYMYWDKSECPYNTNHSLFQKVG